MNIEQLYAIYQKYPLITTDSRDCPSDSIFFALKGTSFDGNQYALSALQKGCKYAVVDEAEYAVDERFILVPDVLHTLQQLATLHRQKWGGIVLQITGTNGKTTTKELVATVLAKKYNVLFTQGNLNNHIGVPRTLLRITNEHDIAVVETGANHPGEIAFLSSMVEADYGIITNVGRAHLEGFGSFEGVMRTKGELYDNLKERRKRIFLNAEDENLTRMADEREMDRITYVEGKVLDCTPFLRIEWKDSMCKSHVVQTHLIGSYNLANLLAAATVGLRFGVSAEDVDDALASYVPTNNRSEFRVTERNHLIVDAYNANPTSMAAALDNFDRISSENKMVILGEMRELGAESLEEHQKILKRLSSMSLQEIWLVGNEFSKCDISSLEGKCRLFPNVDAVQAELADNTLSGRTILIKGSNGTRLFQLPALL